MLIDTHTHLCDERFDGDIIEVIGGFAAADVEYVIEVGYDLASSRKAVELAKSHANVYAAVGVHPCDNVRVTDEDLNELIALARHPKVVALGEIGLDYHYDNDRDIQRYNFTNMLEIATIIGKPIILHLRDAFGEFDQWTDKINASPLPLLFHCYAGSVEVTRQLLKAYGDRAYFAFGGVITFSNFKRQDVVSVVPRDRLLTETDCPYMTPSPHRGERNTPIFVRFVAEKMAQILGVSYDEVVDITSQNAKRLFKI